MRVKSVGLASTVVVGLFTGLAATASDARVAATVTPAEAADAQKARGEHPPESRWAQPRYPGARIFIDAQGAVFIDDEPATPALLHEAFENLARYNGVVWYNRENPSEEPEGAVAQAVDEVIAILTGYKLGVELFEAGFPDPEAHRRTLDNPPPRHSGESAAPEAKEGDR